MKLYYHKTDGGAEYLTDKFIRCADGSKEGVFAGARFIVRIDGDIRKDAELTVKESKPRKIVVHVRGGVAYCNSSLVKIVDHDNQGGC